MEIKVEDIRNNQINLLAQSQNLLEKCEIEKVKEPLYISTSQLYNDDSNNLKSILIDFFKGLKENLIYIISFEEPQSSEDIQGLFRIYKAKKEHDMSKVNDQRELKKKVLYIGSSKGSNLKTRMHNHFGVGSTGVYSMHLIHWLPKKVNSGIKVQLYKISAPEHSTANINLLELIEQGFWDELTPMFGKRSGLS
jgi:hypothetical protein